MERRKKLPTELTLDLGGDTSPDEFLSAVRSFFLYVKEAADSFPSDADKIRWTVKVEKGSNLVGLEAAAGTPKEKLDLAFRAISHGFEIVRHGDFESLTVSDSALGHLQSLSELAERRRDHLSVCIWVKDEHLNFDSLVNQRMLQKFGKSFEDFGSIEGRLEAIRDARGSLVIQVRDMLYPRPVRCKVPNEKIDMVFKSFRKRVEVDGLVSYRSDGVPVSIEARDIDILPDDDTLPSIEQTRGILKAHET